MSKIETILTEALLSSFSPLDTLSSVQLKALVRKSKILDLADGEILFNRGDKDNQGIFIISGSATILAPNGSTVTINCGDEHAKTALAHHQPRQVTVKAKKSLKVLAVNAELLDLFLSWNQQASCDISKTQDQDYWISCLLSSPVFSKLPTENILALTRDMREIEVKKGQAIIKQGEIHDYYYIIKKGSCQISRKIGENGETQIIAELSVGQGFGEESLITDRRRNASVTMLEDGILICMSKKELFENILDPVLSYIPFETYQKYSSSMTLLDVRSPDEFRSNALASSINLPLPVLRLKANSLHKERLYVVCSNDGKRSAIAAYLLIQQGFRTTILKEKLQSLLKEQTTKQNIGRNKIEQHTPPNTEKQKPTTTKELPSGHDKKQEKNRKIVWEISSDYWGCPIANENEEAYSTPPSSPAKHEEEYQPINPNQAVFKASEPGKNRPKPVLINKSNNTKKAPWIYYLLAIVTILGSVSSLIIMT